MSVKLNDTAHEYAQELIRAGKYVADDRDDWSEHQPSAGEENRFIEEHGYRCGLLAAESRAGQDKYDDIEQAAAHLHGMLEGVSARQQSSV